MTEAAGRSSGLLSEAVRTAVHAASLDELLLALTRSLESTFSLWRISVLFFSPDGSRLTIAATWSAAETILAPGSEIAVDLTPSVRRTIETLRSGRPLALRLREMDLGLIGDVIRDEGLASWMAVPICDGDAIVGALSLASSSPSAFDDADVLFFEGLAAGVERRILDLARGNAPG